MPAVLRRPETLFLAGMLLVLGLGRQVLTFADTRLRDLWVRWRVAAHDPANHPWLAKTARFFPLDRHSGEIILAMYDDRAYLGIPGPPPPWNRRVYAHALRTIAKGGPRVVAVDLFFRAPSVYDIEQDQDLIDAVRATPNIVLMSYRRDSFVAHPFPRLAEAAICAPPYFYPYIDESVRKASLVYRPHEGAPGLSFPGEMARLYWGLRPDQVEIRDHEVVFRKPDGDLTVPLDDGENVFLNYNSLVRQIPVVSIFDLYHNRVDPALFKDRIVVVGISNSMLQDRFLTPTGLPEFGSLIHALTVQNLLTNTFLRPPPAYQGIGLGVLLLALSFFGLARWLNPIPYIGVTAALGSGLVAASWYGMIFRLQMLDVAPGLFSLVTTAVFAIGLRYYHEVSEKLRIKNAFQHYVTASVVNEILRDPAKLNLHGEERILTVFFSDVAGFTSLSEGMPPIQVVNLLNEYLTEMTEIIFQYEGLLDKYEGDAIMAVFGAPIGQVDHATRACRAALANQRALARLREKWRQEGRPELHARIGINTGLVVVGNMGSRMRFDYTVIGDNVNLAARLETANKLFSSHIIVGPTTAELVQNDILTRRLGLLQVLGRQQQVEVFEVLTSLDDPDAARLAAARAGKAAFEEAFALGTSRRYTEGMTRLEEYLKDHRNDRPATILYEKLSQFAAYPPPDGWNGVWLQEAK